MCHRTEHLRPEVRAGPRGLDGWAGSVSSRGVSADERERLPRYACRPGQNGAIKAARRGGGEQREHFRKF